MRTIWVIGDTHFGHANILTFTSRADGEALRKFESVKEMDSALIEGWNSVVKEQDHVYHLGDVAMRQQDLWIVRALKGHKRLIRGNHDVFKTKQYIRVGFEEIYGIRVLNNMILSHIPIHPASINSRWLCNVHGHLHANESRSSFTPSLGSRYFNASAEVLGFVPVTLEEIEKVVKEWRV